MCWSLSGRHSNRRKRRKTRRVKCDRKRTKGNACKHAISSNKLILCTMKMLNAVALFFLLVNIQHKPNSRILEDIRLQ